jgi:hypothetical protein
MAAFSLASSSSSDWQKVHRPTTLRLYGTWAGSAQLQCRGVGQTTEISNVGQPILHSDVEQSKLIDHPFGITLEYRVSFTRTSGTLQGDIGG